MIRQTVIKKAWLGVGVVAMSLASSPVLAQLTVDADFARNSSECVESEVHVFVRDGEIEASVVEVDSCEGKILLNARAKAELASDAVSFDGHSVVLDTTVEMVDAETDKPISMTFAVEWVAGNEQIVATTKRDIEAPGEVTLRNRFAKRTLLVAEAFGRVFSSDGRDFVDGPAEDAAITLTP